MVGFTNTVYDVFLKLSNILLNFSTAVRQRLFNFFITRESNIGVFLCRYLLRYPISKRDLEKAYKSSRSLRLLATHFPQEVVAFLSRKGEEERTFLHENMQAAKALIEKEESTTYAEMIRSISFIREKQCLEESQLSELKEIREAEEYERMNLPFPLGQPKTHEAAQRAGIVIPSLLPLFDNAPNKQQLESWAQSQLTPMLRRIAKKIISHIHFVDFDTFLRQLMKVTLDFNQKIGEQPYVLIIGSFKDKIAKGTSELWVTGLALEYCGLKQPADIIPMENLKQYLTIHPEIRHILCLDDAIYSGTQKRDCLTRIFRDISNTDVEIALGVPYISRRGLEVIENLQKEYNRINLLSYQVFPMLMDHLDNEEMEYLSRVCVTDSRRTLTYFSHRFPDFLSTFQPMYTGQPIGCSSTNVRAAIESLLKKPVADVFGYNTGNHYGWNIPYTLPPYRKLPFEQTPDAKEFEEAVNHKRLGKRNNIPFPRTRHSSDICDLFKRNGLFNTFDGPAGAQTSSYNTTALSLDEQNLLDEAIRKSREVFF